MNEMTGTARRTGSDPLAGRRGFTLLEMLTVVIIVGLLLAIGTPSVLHMQMITMRKTSLVTIRMIEGGCNQYYNELEEYPPSDGGLQGYHNIAVAMIGYADNDGYAGNGFSLPANPRKPYGPFNGCEKGRLKTFGGQVAFADQFDYPILYFRADVNGNFTAGDNPGPPGEINARYTKLGSKRIRRPFILCSKGPDGSWPNEVFAEYDTQDDAFLQRDDITSFFSEGN